MPTQKRISVIGLGTMGHGIAQAFAVHGHQVCCFDPLEQARESTLRRIQENLQREVAVGLFDGLDIENVLGNIRICPTESDALEAAAFVTEAVAEDLELKQAMFARFEQQVTPHTILASNTSTWKMSDIAAAMKSPARAINTHWFNPPHIVPLVEVIPGQHTSEEVTSDTVALLESIGKTAVRLRKEIPGFLVNRIQIAMYREILDLLEQDVASAEDIDRAFRASVGFRSAAIGPLQVYDFAGIDINSRVYRELIQEIRSNRDLHKLVQQLVEQGDWGVKTGQGIFKYTPELIDERMSERDERYLALKKLFYASPQPNRAADRTSEATD